MSINLIGLHNEIDDLLSGSTSQFPVLVRSSNTGTVYELGKSTVTVVTDEMVLTGCKLQVGTKIVLLQTD